MVTDFHSKRVRKLPSMLVRTIALEQVKDFIIYLWTQINTQSHTQSMGFRGYEMSENQEPTIVRTARSICSLSIRISRYLEYFLRMLAWKDIQGCCYLFDRIDQQVRLETVRVLQRELHVWKVRITYNNCYSRCRRARRRIFKNRLRRQTE